MSDSRFTEEQILSGLRMIWREELGGDSAFDLNSPISDHLGIESVGDLFAYLIEDGYDFALIADRLERLFGFSCSADEWRSYFGLTTKSREEWERDFAPHFTFRRLVDFIQERAKPISLEPVVLLGKPCLTAGIFRGLEQLAGCIRPTIMRFGPSTPIRRCLRGTHLHLFWQRLRWMIEDQLPPPPRIVLTPRGCLHSLLFKIGIGAAVALWSGDLAGVCKGFGVTLALLAPVGAIVAFINERLNPLPEGIETFGDLSRVLAAIILDQQTECA